MSILIDGMSTGVQTRGIGLALEPLVSYYCDVTILFINVKYFGLHVYLDVILRFCPVYLLSI